MGLVTDANWDESICKKPMNVHSISVTYFREKPAAMSVGHGVGTGGQVPQNLE